MEILILLAVVIINLIVQSTILPYIAVFGIVPNTAILIIISVSFSRGKYYGGFTGLFIGLLQDILYGTILGINGFIYFFLGYFLGKLESKISRENIVLPLLISILATVYYHIMRYVFMFFLSMPVSFMSIFSMDLVVEIIYNLVLMIPIYKLFAKIFNTPDIRFGRK